MDLNKFSHKPVSTRYEIQKGDKAPCKLVSIIVSDKGREFVNFVAEGTHTECQRIKERLEQQE